MNRIDRTFRELKRNHRKALIGYITAGFPNKPSFQKLVPLLQESGLDLLEVGVPFSDPIADGLTIQHASQVALANGVTLDWILKTVRTLRKSGTTIPIMFMSYYNPIYAMGIDLFFRTAKVAGVDGVIIPDLIPEEAETFSRAARREGVCLIFLTSPTTPQSRVRMIATKTRGFLYAVSLTGVTGTKKAVPSQVSRFLKSVRSVSPRPVAVGFGLSTPKEVRAISHEVDGVIVGSALIRAIEKSKGSSYKVAARFVRSLATSLNPGKDIPHAS
jgi:tryptophan synthase alpha chain